MGGIWLSDSISGDICNKIYKNVLHHRYITHTSRNSSEIIDSITVKARATANLTRALFVFTSSLLVICVIGFTLLIIKPIVAAILLSVVGATYWIISKKTKVILNKNSKIYADESGQLTKLIQEGVGAIREILISKIKVFFAIYLELLIQGCAKHQGSQRFYRSFRAMFWRC